jgi:hypothetical protein
VGHILECGLPPGNPPPGSEAAGKDIIEAYCLIDIDPQDWAALVVCALERINSALTQICVLEQSWEMGCLEKLPTPFLTLLEGWDWVRSSPG